MRYYLIAGEASGDMHGANLIKGILDKDSEAVFQFWGGNKMENVTGLTAVKHIRDLAFMGFWEVLSHLPTILNNISRCKKDILAFNPDVVILIDYPGFNFRLFPFLKQQQFKTVYYISPQLWAWKKNRVFKMKKFVDRLYVIFPFEVDFYKSFGIEAHYFGHPLLDEINFPQLSQKEELNDATKTIALLPGSRKQEISYLLPEYIEVARKMPEHHFVVAGLSVHGTHFYSSFGQLENLEYRFDQTYTILEEADAAIVTSGTATLETALLNVPEIICYKGSTISYLIAKQLIKGVSFIGIVNLIMNREIVKEFIQQDVNEKNLLKELQRILNSPHRNTVLNDFDALRTKLGESGASLRIASDLVDFIKHKGN